MTLDGHLKTGLAMSLAWCSIATSMIPGIEATIIYSVALVIFIGNIAPDFMEMGIIPHRTYTHFHIYYLIVLALCAGMELSVEIPFAEALAFEQSTLLMISGFCAGALSHIICDAPYYGGVPIFRPKRKIRFTGVEFDQYMNRIIEHGVLMFWLSIVVTQSAPNIIQSLSNTKAISGANFLN